MLVYVVAWSTAALVFLGLDAAWLSQMGPRLYKPILGAIMAAQVSIAPAIAFYLIYITGLVVFAVAPALQSGGPLRAALLGAALGVVAYGTYDLTNQATLRVWDVRLTLIDLAWGAFASAVAAAAACYVASKAHG